MTMLATEVCINPPIRGSIADLLCAVIRAMRLNPPIRGSIGGIDAIPK